MLKPFPEYPLRAAQAANGDVMSWWERGPSYDIQATHHRPYATSYHHDEPPRVAVQPVHHGPAEGITWQHDAGRTSACQRCRDRKVRVRKDFVAAPAVRTSGIDDQFAVLSHEC